jgi:SulP family sulfate permease
MTALLEAGRAGLFAPRVKGLSQIPGPLITVVLEMRPFPSTLIIRLDRVPFMDITGIQTLEEVIGKLRKRGVTTLLCEANPRVYNKLRTAGVLSGADDGYFGSLKAALVHSGIGSETVISCRR